MRVDYSPRAKKFLDSLDTRISSRTARRMQDDPFRGAQRVNGTPDKIYRIRVGSLRVLFEFENGDVYVITIDKRSRVYKR